jgi:starch synthase
MYSLRYGSVPVVRATGGLADTITDASEENLAAGRANGFVFGEYAPAALEHALVRACDAYRHRPKTWEQIVVTGMKQDWSWARSAAIYEQLYAQTVEKRKARGCAPA